MGKVDDHALGKDFAAITIISDIIWMDDDPDDLETVAMPVRLRLEEYSGVDLASVSHQSSRHLNEDAA